MKKDPKQAAALSLKAYNLAYQKRNRQLIKAVEEQLKVHHAELCEPLMGNRPFGQFTVYQLLAYKFVLARPKPQLNQNTLCSMRATHGGSGVFVLEQSCAGVTLPCQVAQGCV